jgi:hypothetical protein
VGLTVAAELVMVVLVPVTRTEEVVVTRVLQEVMLALHLGQDSAAAAVVAAPAALNSDLEEAAAWAVVIPEMLLVGAAAAQMGVTD